MMTTDNAFMKLHATMFNLIYDSFAKFGNNIIIYEPINLAWERALKKADSNNELKSMDTLYLQHELTNQNFIKKEIDNLNDSIMRNIKPADKVYIIMTQSELNIDFFKFINSLRGKCKHVTIYAYIHSMYGSDINFYRTKASDVESLLKKYIDFDNVDNGHRKLYNWITVTKRFSPLKLYDGCQIHFNLSDFYLTFDTSYGNPVPKIEINLFHEYAERLAKNYAPDIYGFSPNILKENESLLKWIMVKNFVKNTPPDILQTFKKDGNDIWDYITQQGEWASNDNNVMLDADTEELKQAAKKLSNDIQKSLNALINALDKEEQFKKTLEDNNE